MTHDIKENFLNLMRNSIPKQKKKFETLEKFQKEIEEARKLEFNFQEIAELLTQSGLKTPMHRVRIFCKEVLKESVISRKNKKTKKKTIGLSEESFFEKNQQELPMI